MSILNKKIFDFLMNSKHTVSTQHPFSYYDKWAF